MKESLLFLSNLRFAASGKGTAAKPAGKKKDETDASKKPPTGGKDAPDADKVNSNPPGPNVLDALTKILGEEFTVDKIPPPLRDQIADANAEDAVIYIALGYVALHDGIPVLFGNDHVFTAKDLRVIRGIIDNKKIKQLWDYVKKGDKEGFLKFVGEYNPYGESLWNKFCWLFAKFGLFFKNLFGKDERKSTKVAELFKPGDKKYKFGDLKFEKIDEKYIMGAVEDKSVILAHIQDNLDVLNEEIPTLTQLADKTLTEIEIKTDDAYKPLTVSTDVDAAAGPDSSFGKAAVAVASLRTSIASKLATLNARIADTKKAIESASLDDTAKKDLTEKLDNLKKVLTEQYADKSPLVSALAPEAGFGAKIPKAAADDMINLAAYQTKLAVIKKADEDAKTAAKSAIDAIVAVKVYDKDKKPDATASSEKGKAK